MKHSPRRIGAIWIASADCSLTVVGSASIVAAVQPSHSDVALKVVTTP